jgi:hypothetical protein
LLDAVRTSKDGECVTVQNKDSDVRVAKQNNYSSFMSWISTTPRRNRPWKLRSP